MIIDFHTHLDWYQDKKQLYNEIINFSGIIITSSVDLESFEKNKQIAKILEIPLDELENLILENSKQILQIF